VIESRGNELGKLTVPTQRSARFDRFVGETELALEAGSGRLMELDRRVAPNGAALETSVPT
jgi:hypothetical protein